jgi:uncharacterized protein
MSSVPSTAFDEALARIAGGLHVSLTTFRRDGRAVVTPVGCVVEGAALYALTPPDTGKVKRIRNDGHVVIAPCSMRGTVRDGAPVADGVARLLDGAGTARVRRLMARRSPMYRTVQVLDRILRRHRPLVGIAVTAV